MSLYDLDFHAWLHEQADALRRRSANEVDWDNIAEELDDVGRQWRNELKSRYIVLIAHLLKWAYQSDRKTKSWMDTIDLQRAAISEHIAENPSLKSVDADVFANAYRQARILASKESRLPRSAFPAETPFTRDEVKDDDFWPGEPPPENWR